jgi:putative transposase
VVDKRRLVDPTHEEIPIYRQCELLGISRAGYYYRPCGESDYNEHLMRLIDEEYTRHPFYGSRRIRAWSEQNGYNVNQKRVQRLMRKMGIEAIYRKPHLSKACDGHKKYAYLLRGLSIERPDQVWSTDITYIRMNKGFVCLVAVMDWKSRYVLSHRLSTSTETEFCLEALEAALGRGTPEIFNTDQGSRFTSAEFTNRLKEAGVRISMDGRGRALDNIFIERLWRSVKYEEVYLKNYETVREAKEAIRKYIEFYNKERLHQALGYISPETIYLKSNKGAAWRQAGEIPAALRAPSISPACSKVLSTRT